MLLGLDFDNTLICYDTLFHRVALDRGLIPADLPAQKNCVRDYLRQQDQEDQWTHMQGEVYGARITEAESFPAVLPTLQGLAQAGLPLRALAELSGHQSLASLQRYLDADAARAQAEGARSLLFGATPQHCSGGSQQP